MGRFTASGIHTSFSKTACALYWVAGFTVLETFTLKKLECSKQAVSLEYISME